MGEYLIATLPVRRQQQLIGMKRDPRIVPATARMREFHEKWQQVNYPRQVVAFYPRKDDHTIRAIVVRPKCWKEIPL